MAQELKSKRVRGRPAGSGKDDSINLRRVADTLIDHPEMSPWAAINRAVHAIDEPTLRQSNVKRESIVHRLNAKWREQGARILSEEREARQRQKEEQQQASFDEAMAGMTRATERLQPALQAMATEAARLNERLGPVYRQMIEQFAAFMMSPAVRTAVETLASFRLDPKLLDAIDKLPKLAIEPKMAAALKSAHSFEIDPKQLAWLKTGNFGGTTH